MISLRISLFARARDLAGTPALTLEVEPGTTVARLRAILAETVPSLRAILPRCAVAINHDFADESQILTEDITEVALIPPVSGGSAAAGCPGTTSWRKL